MISESPEDRDIYEARLKFAEWDRRALEREFREKGRTEIMIDVILDLQDFVGDPVAEKADLAGLTSDELSAILADLQQRLRSRGR